MWVYTHYNHGVMSDNVSKKVCRCLEHDFEEWLYSPEGRDPSKIEIIVISKDEVEALRLVDICHLSQIEASECMNISSSTIQRILKQAREKLIRAIVHGNGFKIEGGDYVIKNKDEKLD
jgi:uncharacterized protein